jgi:type II secretory pathway pseudopilin PulG
VPTWLEIVLAVVVALIVLLFVLGSLGNARRRRSLDAGFQAQLEEANAALAAARAEDRGWERSNLEAAARSAHGRAHPGADIRELHLVQVVDRPGTESDQARFRVVDAHGEHEILLGRRGDEWVEL